MLQSLTTAATTLMDKFDIFSEVAGDSQDSKFLSDVPNLAYPGDLCCTFYAYKTFAGEQQTACIVEGVDAFIYTPGDFGFKISSFECGKNVRYEFHNKKTPQGHDIMTGAGHVRSKEIDTYIEDHVHEVIIRPYDQWKKASATIFGRVGCWGL